MSMFSKIESYFKAVVSVQFNLSWENDENIRIHSITD